MKINQIKAVMKRYGKAWEKKDINLILDCFTKNGIYQESPLAKPYRGHKAIAKFWEEIVVKNTEGIKFKTGKCYVSRDEKIGFAEWKCKNLYEGVRGKMVGIMILKMKGNKITYLNEYWNTERSK